MKDHTAGQFSLTLSDDLACMLGLLSRGVTDPVPIEILDLGRLLILLAPKPPDHNLLPDQPTRFAEEVEYYTKSISDGPLPFTCLWWHMLDKAFCSPRFANLKLLKVDYLVFDNRRQYAHPEGYLERVEGLRVPTDWLSMTNAIFPGLVAENRVKFEGRIIDMTNRISRYEKIDYSGGIVRATYPQ